MAKLNSCEYCGQPIINDPWHSDCRAAYCEGLLEKIQKYCADKPNDVLPEDIKMALVDDKFDSIANFITRRVKRNEQAHKKQLHNLARSEAVAKALREWDEKHPDPDPRTY